MSWSRRRFLAVVAAGSIAVVLAVSVATGLAAPPITPLSGAIFTTDASGVPVNLNIYAAKEDVYLNGGPGINAPDSAAGLPADTYAFQVTDPSGKNLLSSDAVACRRFTVDASGVIQNVTASGGCAHATGKDGEDLGITVQLFPYDDTPNNGGVYKVWVSPVDLLDCSAPGNKHCFVPRYSKTDNFKVRNKRIVEIDTRFYKPGSSTPIDGLRRHVDRHERREQHQVLRVRPRAAGLPRGSRRGGRAGQSPDRGQRPGRCTVDSVEAGGRTYSPSGGSVTVPVSVKSHQAGDATYFVDVHCGG